MDFLFQVSNFILQSTEKTNNTGCTVVNIEGTTVWENGKRVGSHEQDFNSGSYNNGTASGTDNKYTEGYKDDAYTVVVGDWTTNADGSQERLTTKTCNYCGEEVVEKETIPAPPKELDVSRSKTADPLTKNDDSSLTTDITLSLPSAEEQLESDVVFVMDGSSCNDNSRNAFEVMLTSLAEHIENTNAKINIGVVMFRGVVETYPLEELTTENAATMKNKIVRPGVGGSNMHAGLLAAQEMLAASDTDDSRKYMILISDGIAYTWDVDGVQYQIPTRYSVNGTTDIGSNSCWEQWHGALNWIPTGNDWGTYLDNIKQNIEDSINDLGVVYDRSQKPTDGIYPDGYSKYASTVDVALYKAKEVYDELAGQYNCYAVPVYEHDQYGPKFMEYLAAGKSVTFSDIKNEILYAVDAGSTVVDVIGNDFDVVDLNSFTMKVGDEVLASTVEGNTIYFGKDGDNFRFKVDYTAGDNEQFVWTINEAVSNFAPVQLTYTVKVSEPETVPGVYGAADLDGDGIIDGTDTQVDSSKALYTNESASLTPVDSKGTEYLPVEFPKPSVEYTVPANPGVAITKSVDKTTAVLGDVLTYTVTVKNTGDVALENVTVSDMFTGDGQLRVDALPSGITFDNDSQTFVIDTLAIGQSKSFTLKYTVTLAEGLLPNVIKNTAVIKAVYEDKEYTAKASVETKTISVLPVLDKNDHEAYIIGYEDGTVRPENNITRAEVATIFFRLLEDNSRQSYMSTKNSYTDVNASAWYNTAVSTLSNAGILSGYSDGTFKPNAPITRAEFAAIAARFSEVVYNGGSSFSDVPANHWAARYISLAEHLGWIKGYTDGTFKPSKQITRAEAMTLINRVLEREVEEEGMLPNMHVWSDNTPDKWYYEAVQEATNSHTYARTNRLVPGQTYRYESWRSLLKDPDWKSLERSWTSGN